MKIIIIGDSGDLQAAIEAKLSELSDRRFSVVSADPCAGWTPGTAYKDGDRIEIRLDFDAPGGSFDRLEAIIGKLNDVVRLSPSVYERPRRRAQWKSEVPRHLRKR